MRKYENMYVALNAEMYSIEMQPYIVIFVHFICRIRNRNGIGWLRVVGSLKL